MLAKGSLIKCAICDRELETRILLFTPINPQTLELLSFWRIVVEVKGGLTSLENK